MIRLILADDEALERKYLIQYLEKNYSGVISVVYAARDGAELCEKALSMHPDIILMDIRMPKLDGLEAAALLKRRLPETELVILSAYGEFFYAKQAMKLGVKDFLVKPYMDEELGDTLNSILAGRTANEHGKESEEKVREEFFYEVMERNTVWGLCLHSSSGESRKRELMRLGVSSEKYKCVLFQNEGLERLSEAGIEIVRGFFKLSADRVLIAHSFSYLVLFLFFFEDVRNTEIAQAIRKTANYLESLEGRKGTCGISGSYIGIAESTAAFTEAESYVSDFSISKLSMGAGTEELRKHLSIEEQLCFLIAGRNEAEARLAGSRLFELLRHHSQEAIERELMRSMAGIMQRLNENSGHGIHTQLAITILESCKNIAEERLEGHIYEMILEILAAYKEGQGHGNIRLVRRARQYIKENFAHPITQQKIADELGVSQGYLSKCFRLQEGVGITEYLTEYRIEEAKKQFLAGKRSITDIAYRVGFSDSSYFGKCFRKLVGVSPSEYIAMNSDE